MSNRTFWKFSIIILLILAGLFNSFKISFEVNTINADIGDTAMLWHGYQQIGWVFIKNWIYNIDNWLLSLLPIHFLLFEIFGYKPTLMLWFGYIVFLANAALCGMIAYCLGARIAAIVVPLVLLFSNYFSYIGGLLTFAISHNSTNLYGLICLLFTIKWAQTPKWRYLAIIFAAAVIAGISDPWFTPCYTAPIIVTQLILLKRSWHAPDNQPITWLLAILFFALLAAATQLFGALYFITPTTFPIANLDHIAFQFKLMIKYIGWFFNLQPGHFREENFLATFPGLFSFSIVFLMTISIIMKIKKNLSNDPAQLNFFLIILISIIFIIFSFCLLNQETSKIYVSGARYLINILFLLILGIGVGIEIYWKNIGKCLKIVVSIVSFFYLTASLSSAYPTWKKPTHFYKHEYSNLIDFLSKNRLYYGYADYWNSVVTWLTHDKIRIRAVKFSRINGAVLSTTTLSEPSYQQTSKLWYLPSDIPKDQSEFFIIVEETDNGCPNLKMCVNTLNQQFGKPKKILTFGDKIIMVWPYPLLYNIINGPRQ